MKRFSIGIIGATGATGMELLQLITERNFPIHKMHLMASPKSAGKSIQCNGKNYNIISIDQLTDEKDLDILFFCAGGDISKKWIPYFSKKNVFIIDKSSVFRMEENIPLIVPEINGLKVTGKPQLVCNPNCTATILSMALAPILNLSHFKSVLVSTYQSASGGGFAMMEELKQETRRSLNNENSQPKHLPWSYAFNLFSHHSPINEFGYNQEEWKLMEETKKILDLPELEIHATCIRVPVLRSHAETVTVEFESNRPSIPSIKKALSDFPGIKIVDDPEKMIFPMPSLSTYHDEIFIGRLRHDPIHPLKTHFFICSDQLRKGAALNAIQIAETYIASHITA